jgi:flagellar protein FlbD
VSGRDTPFRERRAAKKWTGAQQAALNRLTPSRLQPIGERESPGCTTTRNGSMIVVTRLNGSRFAVNSDLIERIQENPDTTLVMVDGATYVVRESLTDVIDLIARYRAFILATASGLPVTEGQHLTVVPDPD